MKGYIITAVVAVLAIAVVSRIPQVKAVVFGA